MVGGVITPGMLLNVSANLREYQLLNLLGLSSLDLDLIKYFTASVSYIWEF